MSWSSLLLRFINWDTHSKIISNWTEFLDFAPIPATLRLITDCNHYQLLGWECCWGFLTQSWPNLRDVSTVSPRVSQPRRSAIGKTLHWHAFTHQLRSQPRWGLRRTYSSLSGTSLKEWIFPSDTEGSLESRYWIPAFLHCSICGSWQRLALPSDCPGKWRWGLCYPLSDCPDFCGQTCVLSGNAAGTVLKSWCCACLWLCTGFPRSRIWPGALHGLCHHLLRLSNGYHSSILLCFPHYWGSSLEQVQARVEWFFSDLCWFKSLKYIQDNLHGQPKAYHFSRAVFYVSSASFL